MGPAGPGRNRVPPGGRESGRRRVGAEEAGLGLSPTRGPTPRPAVVDVDEVVAPPPWARCWSAPSWWSTTSWSSWVDDVVEVFVFVDFPLTGGTVVVVVVVGVEPGAAVPSTCWAALICWSIIWRSCWNCVRLSALSAARALL